MMKKNLSNIYVAPQVEEDVLTMTAVLCGSVSDITSGNEGFIEDEIYNW